MQHNRPTCRGLLVTDLWYCPSSSQAYMPSSVLSRLIVADTIVINYILRMLNTNINRPLNIVTCNFVDMMRSCHLVGLFWINEDLMMLMMVMMTTTTTIIKIILLCRSSESCLKLPTLIVYEKRLFIIVAYSLLDQPEILARYSWLLSDHQVKSSQVKSSNRLLCKYQVKSSNRLLCKYLLSPQ